MLNNKQLNSIFSISEEESDYEEEKRKNKQKLVRNEFEKSGKYGIPLLKKQNINIDKIELLSYQLAQLKNWILLCPLKPFKTLAFLLVFFLLLSKCQFLDAT